MLRKEKEQQRKNKIKTEEGGMKKWVKEQEQY